MQRNGVTLRADAFPSLGWQSASCVLARVEEDRSLLGLSERRVSRCERSLALTQMRAYTGSCEVGY